MNQLYIPTKQNFLDLPVEINGLADNLIEKFKVSSKGLSNQNWSLLSEILDFAAEAEQTIAEQKIRISELESLATTDEITGLLNRRGMTMELQHALAGADRHGEYSVFVYIDLDDFKQINDSYGHDAGDAMLRHISNTLQDSIRLTDYAARLGGDEFALLLTHSEPVGAKSRLRMIQNRLEKSVFEYGKYKLPLKASFGIAEILPGSNQDKILQQADQAMYRNKQVRKKNKIRPFPTKQS